MLVKICFKDGVERKVRSDGFVVDVKDSCYVITRYHLRALVINFSEVEKIYIV